MLKEDLDYILTKLDNEINLVSKKKILITGGTGFFGISLLNAFQYMIEEGKHDFSVDVISRSPQNFKISNPKLYHFKNFEFIKQNINEPFSLKSKYDFVIHAATSASKTINENSFDVMAQTIIDGTINTLNACKNDKLKFLYISSGAVYGENSAKKKSKENDFNSINPIKGDYAYHIGKLLGENLCYSYGKKLNMDIKIARCFAFVGPYLPLDKHFAIGNFINCALSNNPITIKSKGKSTRSFLYSSDLVVWLIKILCSGENLKPYNVGSPEEITVARLASKIGDLKDLPIKIQENFDQESFYVPDTSMTMSDLDIKSFISLDSAIKKTIEWHESK